MRVCGERAGCLRPVMLSRGRPRELRLLGVLHHQGRPVTTTGPPELEVASSCTGCGTGATASVSLEEVGCCGFDGTYLGIRQDTA